MDLRRHCFSVNLTKSQCFVAFRKPLSGSVEHQRHVGIGGLRVPKQVSEIRLSRRRGQEIVSAGYLVYPRCGIVDDDGKVV